MNQLENTMLLADRLMVGPDGAVSPFLRGAGTSRCQTISAAPQRCGCLRVPAMAD